MRILLINHYAGSPEYGMEYRPYYLASEWVKRGHQVTILAAGYSHLRQKNPPVARSFELHRIHGIRYRFVKTPRYHSNGAARAGNILSFVGQLIENARPLADRLRPQVVIASSTYPFDMLAAARIASLSGAHLIYEIHDLWPLTQIELYGYKRGNPAILLTQWMENFALDRAERVVSILPDAGRYLHERGRDPGKLIHIPNGVCIPPRRAEHPPLEQLEQLRRCREAGQFLVLYLGSMGGSNALEPFVEAAGMAGPDLAFVTVGDGPKKAGLMEYASRHGIGNLLFLDPVQRDQVPYLLEQADCLYLGAKRCSLYRYGVGMNKLYDYMLAAKPIIYGVCSSNRPVQEAHCGITIPPEQPAEIVRAVRRLQALPPERRRQLGENGRRYVTAHHDYALLAGQFLSVMEGLACGDPGQGGGELPLAAPPRPASAPKPDGSVPLHHRPARKGDGA